MITRRIGESVGHGSPPDRSIRVDEIQGGDIYWLPSEQNCGRGRDTNDTVIELGCYEHPVLIYAIRTYSQEVLALIVSFTALIAHTFALLTHCS